MRRFNPTKARLLALALCQTWITGTLAAGAGGPAGVTPINQGWLFGGEYTPGSEAPDFDDKGFQQVTIPHVVTPLGWNNWDNNTWNKVWIYRKHFDLPASSDSNDPSSRTFLDFDSVLTIAAPSINGHALPAHEGGYLPFSYEITHLVNRTGNTLSVLVDARWSYVNPEGSPLGPQSVDYLEPGGINRDVAIRTVSSAFISDVFAKPFNVLGSSAAVAVECTIDSVTAAEEIEVHSQLLDSGKVLSQATQKGRISGPGNQTFNFNVSAPHVQLWSPDNPKLYQLVTALTVGGITQHTFTRNIGFREAVFQIDGFYLNGERFKIFGLDRHQIFPYIGMSASERLQKRDADLLKDLNCNMVRCSHYPQSPYFLDRCDELGIMVWQEVPGWQFIGNSTWQEHVVSDVHDMVIRDRSRPSIILWGVQVNESPREPQLYTETKQLAYSLDDSRQASGTETSQSLTDWVSDVFAYDDYHSSDGNAYLLPPLTSVPYLITESVGALDGPRFFRWIDEQYVQQDQAKLHAQVHDIAASNDHFSGLLGWAAIDYQSLQGNIYNNIKWPGIMDTFRVYKPGAAFYLTQRDPSAGAIIEPAFYWDFGPTSPITTLAKNATIWSNCDSLETYVDGSHFATLKPDTTDFAHTAYPPFYLDTTKIKASSLPDLRLDGYVSGKKVASRTFSGSTKGDHIQLVVNDQELTADGIDSTLISFRAVDKYGNPRPYASGDVKVSVTGPAEWVGQLVAFDVVADPPAVPVGKSSKITATLQSGVFLWTENGGVGGAVIRTIAGHPGTIEISVSHATLGIDSARIQAVKSPGSIVASVPRSPTISNADLSLVSAMGWSIISPDTVSLGSAATSVHATWTLSPTATGQFVQPPTASASFDINDQRANNTATVPVAALLSLEQARDNIGISSDSDISAANFDGKNNSFSAQALAKVDLKPGVKFTVDGVAFTWPDVQPGLPDNVIAIGQTIQVNGTGKKLGIVGASTNAFNGGIASVYYTDGSVSQFTLDIGNYLDDNFLTNTVVVTTAYINNGTSQGRGPSGTLFYSGTSLAAGKTVLAVGLPSTVAPSNKSPAAALHIFSIAIS